MPKVKRDRVNVGAQPNATGIALAPPAYGIAAADHQSSNSQPNRTGLPDRLRAAVETLSGIALDDVRVHLNSPRPAQLQALAYTQGNEIHVAPGQELHLPHEAWHVVQQQQGRVRATRQLKGGHINDDAGLEREADVMGRKVESLQRAARVSAQVTAEGTNYKLVAGDGRQQEGPRPSDQSLDPLYHFGLAATSNTGFTVQRMDAPEKKHRFSSVRVRVQSANIEDIVIAYSKANERKVAFNAQMSGGWERWLQGEIFFLLAESLGAHISVEDHVYNGGQRADFTIETGDNTTLIIVELKCQTALETNAAFQKRVNADINKLKNINYNILNTQGIAYERIEAFQLVLSSGSYDALQGYEHTSEKLKLDGTAITLSVARRLWQP